jgi:hypothetical protein
MAVPEARIGEFEEIFTANRTQQFFRQLPSA